MTWVTLRHNRVTAAASEHSAENGTCSACRDSDRTVLATSVVRTYRYYPGYS